jgi:hypothetical protein
MTYYRSAYAFLVVLWMMIVLNACAWSWGPRQVVDPDIRADLLIYFIKETREEEVMRFWDIVLSIPDPRGGFQLLPGISGVMVNDSVQGYQSLRVDFWSSATPEQRAEVKNRVLASPLVYKILEDTIPNSVMRLDDTE